MKTIKDNHLIMLFVWAALCFSNINTAVAADDETVSRPSTQYFEYKWLTIDVKDDAGNLVFPDPVRVRVRFVPQAMQWEPQGNSQDYNDPLNWTYWTSPNDSKSAQWWADNTEKEDLGFVPWSCTDVLIPENTSSYPDLKGTITARDVLNDNTVMNIGDPICRDMWFEHGGEMASTDLLTYREANVELDLMSNRWYMFSAPLRQLFAGDIYLSVPYPPVNDGVVMYAQVFRATNPQKMNSGAQWTGFYNTAEHQLKAGKGTALWADFNTGKVEGKYTYNESDFTVTNPVQTATPSIDALVAHNNPQRFYESNTGTGRGFWFPKHDTEYLYYEDYTENPTGNTSGLLNKANLHRFVYEELPQFAPGQDFTIDVSATAGDMFLVGNPFMSHLDFEKFYAENSSKIEKEYRVVVSSDFDGVGGIPTPRTRFYAGGGAVATDPDGLGKLIAPMQSVILTAKRTFSDGLTFNGEMTGIRPAHRLRAASEAAQSVTITATMGVQNNTASLIYSPLASNKFIAGEDSYKLYNDMIFNNYPNTTPLVLYTASSDGFPLEVNSFGDTDENIKLGLRTSLTGEITLDFSGLDHLYNLDVFLRDLEKGQIINLHETPAYTFDKTSEQTALADRFELVFKTPTALDNPADDAIAIITSGGRLKVISHNGLLQSVQVFDMQGRLIVSETNIESQVYTCDLQANSMYVVKASTGHRTEVKKVITQ